jgi:hypothetical protein
MVQVKVQLIRFSLSKRNLHNGKTEQRDRVNDSLLECFRKKCKVEGDECNYRRSNSIKQQIANKSFLFHLILARKQLNFLYFALDFFELVVRGFLALLE